MTVRLLSLFLVVLTVAACPAPTRSLARISQVEYRPDDTGNIIEWTYDYDGDGFLTKIEREVGGNADVDTKFSYDANGNLEELELDSGTQELVFTIGYEDGNWVSATAEIDYRDEGQDLDIETRFDWSASYVDGRLAERVENETTIAQREGAILGINITTDSEVTYSYAYADDGTLTKVIYDERWDQETDWTAELIPDESSSERIDAETRYTYDDNGQIQDIELDQERNLDGNESTTTLDTEFKFDDEGKLTEVEEALRIGDDVFDDEYTLEYDEDGRITRIEDEDGNRYDIDYEEGDIQGVTLAAPGEFPHAGSFDVTGRFFSDFRFEHLSLP